MGSSGHRGSVPGLASVSTQEPSHCGFLTGAGGELEDGRGSLGDKAADSRCVGLRTALAPRWTLGPYSPTNEGLHGPLELGDRHGSGSQGDGQSSVGMAEGTPQTNGVQQDEDGVGTGRLRAQRG